MSAERPILFSGPMVRAILDGRKTQTRRVFRNHWGHDDTGRFEVGVYHPTVIRRGQEEPGDPVYGAWSLDGEWAVKSPYGQPGDRLWVRETWADTNGESGPMISYRAGGDRFLVDESYPVDYSRYPSCAFTMWCGDLRSGAEGHAWRSPIHMPRWASRITLEITEVRVERVQEISDADIVAEGILDLDDTPIRDPFDMSPAQARHVRAEFRGLWDSLNKSRGYGWDTNPWVWVIGFRRLASGVEGEG